MAQRPALVHVDDLPFESRGVPAPSGVRVPISGRQGSPHACFFARYFPGLTRPMHRHENCDELVFFVSGRGRFGPDGREVRGGHARRIPRGGVHWLRNASPDEPVVLTAFFDGAPSMGETGTVTLGAASEEDFRSMPPGEGARVYPTVHLDEVAPLPIRGGGLLRPLLGSWCGARSLLFHLALPPGAALPEGLRLGGELICTLTRGAGEVHAAGEKAQARAGHYQFVPRGTEFGLSNPGAEGPLECAGVVFGAGTPEAAGWPVEQAGIN